MKSPPMLCPPCSQLGWVSHVPPALAHAGPRATKNLGSWGCSSTFHKELFPRA